MVLLLEPRALLRHPPLEHFVARLGAAAAAAVDDAQPLGEVAVVAERPPLERGRGGERRERQEGTAAVSHRAPVLQ